MTRERSTRILSGLIATLMASALVTAGVKAATGALRPRYQIEGLFAAAGQGLITGSDVKIHGVNIGRVAKVRLEGGRALVRMDIDDDERVPVSAKATIRPKTLFGEKFVDIEPGPDEVRGPFLADEDRIADTTGGFELERVLAELYPILKAVDPVELAVIVDTLADGGRGTGPAVNRQLAAWRAVTEVQARHSVDTRRFLADFADISDELAVRADDVVGAAKALNDALPTVNARGEQVGALLGDLARLSHDVADLLEANAPLATKMVTEGGKTLQVLSDRRSRIGPLVVGLRQYVQVLGEVPRIPFGDGTLLAAVKVILAAEDPCARQPAGCAQPQPSTSFALAPAAGVDDALARLPVATTGVRAIRELLGAALA